MSENKIKTLYRERSVVVLCMADVQYNRHLLQPFLHYNTTTIILKRVIQRTNKTNLTKKRYVLIQPCSRLLSDSDSADATVYICDSRHL